MKVTKIEQPEHANLPTRIDLVQSGIKIPVVAEGTETGVQNRFDVIAPRLFNLEPHSQTEKPLGLKLNLYQMESP